MKKSEFKNPEAEATKRQTFAIYCLTKTDVRGEYFTRWQASQIIGKCKKSPDKALAILQAAIKENKRELREVANGLWEKSGKTNPMTVKAVVKSKSRKLKSKQGTDQMNILREAQRAGEKAMAEKIPVPMVVQQHASVLDDNSQVVKEWKVPAGVCGFAWVVVKCKGPGIRFINALKKAGIAGGENSHCEFSKSSYHKGFYHHIHGGGQSYEKKTAYAHAFAAVLNKYEIPCYSGSRLD